MCSVGRQAAWSENGSQAAHPPAGAAVARQGLQEVAFGNTLEVQSLRRRVPRKGHRAGESVRCCWISYNILITLKTNTVARLRLKRFLR